MLPIKRLPKDGYVYLMYEPVNSLYKIGFTQFHPNLRIQRIKFDFPNIELVNYCFCQRSFEKVLHNYFSDKNVRLHSFNEYFKLSFDDFELIQHLFKTFYNRAVFIKQINEMAL